MASEAATIPSTMQAWSCAKYGAECVLVGDRAVPAPGIGEALVKVHFAALDPLDLKLLAGEFKDRFAIDAFPIVPGFDVAGEVITLGPECSRLTVGDRVVLCLGVKESLAKGSNFGPCGALAEYCVCPEEQISKVPDSILLTAVAGLPLAGLSAYQALFTGKGTSTTGEPLGDIAEGSSVLVIGGERSVGHLAVQMAKGKGASVVATVPFEKVHWMEKVGASEVVDYKEVDWLQTLRGRDFDLILDCADWAASSKEIERVASLLKPGGLFVGTSRFAALEAAGGKRDDGRRFLALVPKAAVEDLDVLVDWIGSGRLEVLNEKVYAFKDAGSAMHAKLTRCGKAIICQCSANTSASPCCAAAGA
eukprot:TRINITY_DN6587_c0_g1_i3.p1 TRINITY_DN6587_c0_g1~~TRINITY_DN6587_c0_g1_i3.p1  ORF type:complete len:363 (+),score=87.05 TRINITY_DN6587_c0_g1_i3:58-1146(+)